MLISGGANTAPSWTAQSNLSVGTAAKLGTGTTTYTAWGQTYWSSGVPQDVSGSMYMNNNNVIYWKDNPSSGTATNMSILEFSSSNNLHVGYGSAAKNYNTYISGYAVYLRYGANRTTGITLASTGAVTIAGATTLSSSLSVNSGITLTTTKKIYFGDTSHYIELTSTGFHFSHGVYSDSFVSALGANSSGGGGGGVDLTAVWASLTNTENPTYSTTLKINSNHIPNLNANKITEGTLAAARIPIATASAVGGIKVGTTLAISDGVLNQKSGIATAGTYKSVTVDTYGRVTAGTNPTTLSGYGITNAYTKTQVDNALGGYLPLSGGTLTGTLAMKFDTDTSRACGYQWKNTSGTSIASIIYHNTAQNIILNPVGSSETWSDAVGKYSLIVGNNSLTYNTYHILHSNNYSSYALPLSGGTLTGNVTFNGVNKGIYLTDSGGNTFAGIIQNGTNLWIGAQQTTATHHTGGTYISAGDNRNLFVSKLVNDTRTNYIILDTDNTYTSSGKGYIFGTEITTISGNATTATTASKLSTTSKTAWGQTYWTSGGVPTSISGNLSSVGNITADYYTLNSTATNPYLKLAHTYNSTNYNYYIQAYNGLLYLGAGSANSVAINSSGNVGIGTASPAYALDVVGTTRSSGGFRTATANGSYGFLDTRGSTYCYLDNYNSGFATGMYIVNSSGTNLGSAVGVFGSSNAIGRYYYGGTWDNPLMTILPNGNVGIGVNMSSPTSKLAVDGDIVGTNLFIVNNSSQTTYDAMVYLENKSSNDWAMKIDCGTYAYGLTITATGGSALSVTGNIYSSSEITAASDERAKNVLGDANLDLKYIADAPNVLYEWKDASIHGKGIHGGSLAQYWLKDERSQHFVSQDKDSGMYSLNYGALGTSLAISVAKYVLKHEDEITRLKKEVVKLRERVAELEERRVA